MSRNASRREFLTGKAAQPGRRELASSPVRPGVPTANRDDPLSGGYLIRVSRPAMACDFEVVFNAGQYAGDTEAASRALDAVGRLEEQLSFFQPESEISRINREAVSAPVAVEPWLFDLLELAQSTARLTAGAYDITATPLWEVWGFSRRAGRVPSPEQLAAAMHCVGHRFVQLDPRQRTVRLTRAGVRLSLGSIGKGHAVDRCVEVLTEAGIHDFLLQGGQSSVAARGARAGTPSGESRPDTAGGRGGWTVALRDPLRPQRKLGEILLCDRALGTSGSVIQSFRHRGRRYGHILDPRTGWPAEGVLQATVLAPTAALADALSTAFCVLGPEGSREYCAAHNEMAAVLLCPSQGGPGFQTVTLGDPGIIA
jgi:thiamine biosynthesis lipoprotein